MKTLSYSKFKNFRILFAVVFFATTISFIASTHSHSADSDGVHDFDFLVGEWRVHHKYLRVQGDRRDWAETDGTCTNKIIMNGSANIDENIINAPSGQYQGIGLRSYDPKTKQWSIWWLDGRAPSGPLDPAAKGSFEKGIGTFYYDYEDKGKPMRMRLMWSQITKISARWEQASSSDDGKTWETNWIMSFQRKS